ncbi:S8 family serine peptidase [Microbacterium hominis]|uniref:S8 family serine peptidase n=1 Tax=Microbacterium hominis TaxID=162426 RepID=A0A7D4Q1F5_9MICO|nr:S8 family serine peptidase [Microbacterium hominis]QKJ19798.1 S8 family serine peptidase [Microbacterium hominis]
MFPRPRAIRSGTALAVTALLCSAIAPAAMAAEVPASTPTGIDPTAQPVSFTLVTGDVVHAYVTVDGALTAPRLESTDGEELWSTWIDGDSTYVVPADVQALVEDGTLDPRLFDIAGLWADGFDDASMDSLPVIVEYADGTAARAAVKGALVTAELDAIDADALSISKSRAAAAWAALQPAAGARSGAGVEHIWLDAKVEGASLLDGLEPTVPLTGATVAHELGFDGSGVTVAVLDTGFDQQHADLTGRVAQSRSFVTYSGQTIQDRNGHGTHVGSTVAGTGVASDGVYAGVAPGADLLVGKVLADDGSGLTSWILQGMQWAVDSGADIVSMSLGNSSSTSCVGPDVNLVEALSDSALFVIAAGNEGLRGQVSTPGCAPSALTVGAVDRDNATASFSSRGPAVGGTAAKPDIASQGVDVVAARAGGSDELAYAAYSGTSMATPHVAGGAAIVLQANPDLTPAELKRVLTSSAAHTEASVLEQGAGPMDVARAVAQPVQGVPNRQLASFAYPQRNLAATTRSIALTNTSDADVTLDLALHAFGDDGSSVPPTMFTLGIKQKRLVVPAGGSVDVPVVIDPSVALDPNDYGTVTGRLVGTGAGDVVVTVPFSVHMQVPTSPVTVITKNRLGDGPDSVSSFQMIDTRRGTGSRYTTGNGSLTLALPHGVYDVAGMLMTRDAAGNQGQVDSVSLVFKRSVKIAGPTTIVLDAREASELAFKADKAAEPRGFSLGYTYGLTTDGRVKTGVLTTIPSYVKHLYTTPGSVDGAFTFSATARLVAPGVALTSSGGHTVDDLAVANAPEFDGVGSAPLLHIGAGTAANLQAADVAGKLLLIDANPAVQGGNPVLWNQQLRNRGAVGVLAYSTSTEGRIYLSGTGVSMPMASITAADARALQAELAAGPVTMSWKGSAASKSPFVYNLASVMDAKIPTGIQRVKDRDLATVPTQYYSQGLDSRTWYSDLALELPGAPSVYASGTMLPVQAPLERVEYYTASPDVPWTTITRMTTNLASAASFEGPRAYTPGSTAPTSWFRTPLGSGGNTYGTALVDRDLNDLRMSMSVWNDAAGHDSVGLAFSDTATRRVWVDGVLAPITPTGTYTVPSEAAQVRIEKTFTRRLSTTETLGLAFLTNWTFETDRADQGAQGLLLPVVEIPMELTNRVPEGTAAEIVLSAMSDATDERADLSSVTLQYATGTATTVAGVTGWTDLPVSANADGTWSATVPATLPAGAYVHLRTVMTAQDGSTVEQTMVRSYQVRAR